MALVPCPHSRFCTSWAETVASVDSGTLNMGLSIVDYNSNNNNNNNNNNKL